MPSRPSQLAPAHLAVDGLFGHLAQHINLRRTDRTTILTGPNGSGKTTVLKILQAMLALDLSSLARLPFATSRLTYLDGSALLASRAWDRNEQQVFQGFRQAADGIHSSSLLIEGFDRRGDAVGFWDVPAEPDLLEDVELPWHYERIAHDRWIDTRDGEIVSSDLLLRRYARPHLRSRAAKQDPPPSWLERYRSPAAPTLIATARLDVGALLLDRVPDNRSRRIVPAASQIRLYVRQISALMDQAKNTSLLVSQRADRRFATIALEKTRKAAAEAELRDRYQRIVALLHDLHENGLAEESIGLTYPEGRKSPVERRFLTLFLDDWEDKLRPLQPVHEKLQLLRRIVGEKMKGKSLVINDDGESLLRLGYRADNPSGNVVLGRAAPACSVHDAVVRRDGAVVGPHRRARDISTRKLAARVSG